MKKISESTIEQLRGISPDELVAHGVISRAPNFSARTQTGYVCPLCGSGTGRNHNGQGDGAGSFDEQNRFFCYACQNESVNRHKLSTIDLFAFVNNLQHESLAEQCRQMARKFNVGIDFDELADLPSRRRRSATTIAAKPAAAPAPKSDEEIALIREDLSATDDELINFVRDNGGTWRGLPIELLQKHGCKYSARWTSVTSRVEKKFATPTPRVLIPFDDETGYLARLTVPIETFDEKTRKYIKPKQNAGTISLFNGDALNDTPEPIFCIEGAIDALSVEFAGFKVCALNGRGNGNLLVDAVATKEKKPRVIILLDADDAGRKAAPNLHDELINVGCPCVVRFLSNDVSKIDANEILTTSGVDFLRGKLQSIFDDSLAELDAVEKKIARDDELDAEIYMHGLTKDMHNARRLVKFCGNRVRWLTDSERWLIWDNKGVWQKASDKNSCLAPFVADFADLLTAYAVKLDKELEKAAAAQLKAAINPDGTISTADDTKKPIKSPEQSRRDKAFELVYAFTTSKKVSAAISMMKGESSILITQDDLDNHPELLNCLNGVVDLHTGKLYPADPALLLTQQCRAPYNPRATSELVDKFFLDIMPDDMTRAGLLRWLGYNITGETSAEKFMVLHGGGANGKGVLGGTLLYLLDNYGAGLAPRALLKSNRFVDANNATTSLNPLEGARFALSEEIPADAELDASLVKNLTGGDKINLRRNFGEYRTIENHAKINISGNYLPKIENTADDGLLRRMLTMPFTVKFGVDKPADSALKKKMLLPENLRGLLKILVDEAVAWYRGDDGGLIISPLMSAEREKLLRQSDFVGEFVDDNYILAPNASVKAKDFLDDLKRAYPRECSRFSRADLIRLVERAAGVTYGEDRKRNRIFTGIGKAATSDNDFGGEPISSSDYNPYD